MDDAVLVRFLERRGDLLGDLERLFLEIRPRAQHAREVLALDQLHHEEPLPLSLLESVDGGDVRMAQRREDPRFVLATARAARGRTRTRRAAP